MKIQIIRIKDNIASNIDVTDLADGELPYILCELDVIKQKLLAMYRETVHMEKNGKS